MADESVNFGGYEDAMTAYCSIYVCECQKDHDHIPSCWSSCGNGDECLVALYYMNSVIPECPERPAKKEHFLCAWTSTEAGKDIVFNSSIKTRGFMWDHVPNHPYCTLVVDTGQLYGLQFRKLEEAESMTKNIVDLFSKLNSKRTLSTGRPISNSAIARPFNSADSISVDLDDHDTIVEKYKDKNDELTQEVAELRLQIAALHVANTNLKKKMKKDSTEWKTKQKEYLHRINDLEEHIGGKGPSVAIKSGPRYTANKPIPPLPPPRPIRTMGRIRKTLVEKYKDDEYENNGMKRTLSMVIEKPDGMTRTVNVEFDFKSCKYTGIPSEWTGTEFNVLFGLDLHVVPKKTLKELDYNFGISGVLLMLEKDLIEKRGLHTVGIFRVAPFKGDFIKVKSQINTGQYDHKASSPHVLAGLIKAYLRELPKPLYSEFNENEIRIASERPAHMCGLMVQDDMREPEKSCLLWVLDLMSQVVLRKSINKMGIIALSTVFAPNLFYVEMDESDFMRSIEMTQKSVRFTSSLLQWRLHTKHNISFDEMANMGV